MTINELREKRNQAWNAAKAFVETKRDKDGLLSDEDSATYAQMEKKVQDYGAEIERMEAMSAMEAQLNKPTSSPITEKPMNGKSTADEKPKTGRASDAYRTGMLTPVAVMALRNYIGDRPGTDPLFLADRAPHNRMKEYGIEKLAKEMAVRGGVTRITATVHVYRKTFASVLYRKTGDVLLVSKLLGHAKPDMTVQYYLIDDIEEMQHKYNRVA